MPVRRWRKVLRDIWSAKTRTALVVLSVAVGVFAFGTIVGARDIVNRELNRGFLAIGPASATFTLDAFDQELVDAIARRPDIAAAQGRQVLSARVQTGLESFQQIQIVAVPDLPMTVNRLEPEQGAWPPPPKTILLERTALPLFDVAVGDTLLLDLPQGTVCGPGHSGERCAVRSL